MIGARAEMPANDRIMATLIVMGALYYLRPHEIPEMRGKIESSTARSHLGFIELDSI